MYKKRKNKEPQHLSALLESELGKFSSSPPVPLPIIRAWESSVGQKILNRARPIKMFRSTLVVRVTSSAWMTELQMLSPVILEKLRKATGRDNLKKLKFELGELPPIPKALRTERPTKPTRRPRKSIPKPIAQALKTIKDSELRSQIEAALHQSLP